jgi:predicted GNAT family N-acyltransferase
MASCKIVHVKSNEDREKHFRVRWQVFGQEENLLRYENPSGLEVDEYDKRPTALHFNIVVPDDDKSSADAVIGAGRLILPDRELAAANGWQYGLPLERKFSFAPPPYILPEEICEMGRMCVLRAWRSHRHRQRVLAELLIEMCHESLRRGIHYWLAVATGSTDLPTEAVRVMRTLEARGLTRADVSLQLREPIDSHVEALQDIEVGAGTDLQRLPPVVELDAHLGARYFGQPIFDTYFGVYAFPLLGPVRDCIKNAQAMLT